MTSPRERAERGGTSVVHSGGWPQFAWPYDLGDVMGWLVILAVIAAYAVMFALTRPARLRWWITTLLAVATMIALIVLSLPG